MSRPLDPTDLRNLGVLLAQAGDIVEPPPNRTADEWADACRILPEGSPEPGPWRTDRVPYTRDIYRAFSDPRYTTIVGVMGAQMSKTELLLNVLGHRFTDGPYVPALDIGPTEKQVRSMSNDRVMKMLRSTPVPVSPSATRFLAFRTTCSCCRPTSPGPISTVAPR